MSALPVLYVNHVSVLGGAEQSLLSLLGQMDRGACQPALACPPGELATRAAQLGIETYPLSTKRFRRTHNPLDMSNYALIWVTASNQLRKVVKDFQPKVIHANSATAQLYAGAVAQDAKIPVVWHSRDLRPLPFPARALCRNADKVVAVSDAVADFLAGSGLSRPKVTRIYNGIDPEAWRARVTGRNVKEEMGLAPGDRIVLMAAQFVPWKRHEDAIRALPLILEKEPAARLALVGEDRFGEHPDLLPKLQALAGELRVRDKVIFMGQRDDVPDLMAAADLVVIPSDAEPFGRVAIEAMSIGRPIVGTRAGGLPEVVRDGETGLLVVPRFPESLAAACVTVLTKPDVAKSLGEAGPERVRRHFHISRTVSETLNLYEMMLHPPLKWIHA